MCLAIEWAELLSFYILQEKYPWEAWESSRYNAECQIVHNRYT